MPTMPRLTHRRAGWIALLLMAVAVFAAAPARAQEDITLETLRVQIWPEYDQPAALVIVSGQTAEGVETPVDITFPLPPDVTLNAVAYTDPASGEAFIAQYEEQGGAVTLNSPNGQFLLEYYDNSLAFEGDVRRYTLSFEMPYDVERLMWEVQQPVNASNLTLDTSGSQEQGTDATGLPVRLAVEGPVEAGQTVTLGLSYEKSDETLSIDQLAAPGAVEPPPEVDAGGPSTLVIVLVVLGGLAIIGGSVYWYMQQTRRPQPRRRAASTRRSPKGGTRGGAPRGQRFCTNCGEAALPGDKFCRNCGERL